MVIILDYGMGNVGSIKNILHKIGEKEVIVSHDINDIEKADKMILPGVGTFDSGINNLKKIGLIEMIQKYALIDKKPVLSICFISSIL